MNHPDFLIIGGMKCGSTTVYDDLARTGTVSFPDKELNFFNRGATDEEFEAYRSRFSGDGLQGDVSTAYAMKPRYEGTAQRAFDRLGSIPIVYMVRNPIERAISHHHHLQARGATDLPFGEALAVFPEIVDFGRYDMQVAEWDDAFGADNVLVMPLERYRSGGIDDLLTHLGASVASTVAAGHSNSTTEARVFTGTSRVIYESWAFRTLYINGVRKLVPVQARSAARRVLLPKPPQRDTPPPVDSLRELIPAFDGARQMVARRTGIEWDLDATCERLGEAS